MKYTPFTEIHKRLGAKMVEFAGFLMPLQYSGINDEHITVRKAVGVFDVSHMGEIWIKGKNAFALTQYITSNDIQRLVPGKALYSVMPNGRGGIVDDLIVYQYDDDSYLLVVNAANTEKDFNWILKQNEKFGAEVENASDRTAQLAVQGPKAIDTLQKLTDIDLSSIKFYHFVVGSIAGVDNVIISATGYTGSGGFELYFDPQYAEKMWNAIFEAGKEFGIKPAGLGARDTLRLEMGYCLYGNDIDETTSPIEAGLGWVVKFVDGNDFIDRDFLWKQKQTGVSRRLVGFEMIDRGIPRHGYEIYNEEGQKIGKVTSGTMSPMLRKGIGMGYVNTEYSKPGNQIFIDVRGKKLKAQVVKPPFYKPEQQK
jgi:aminomethyltransferase